MGYFKIFITIQLQSIICLVTSRHQVLVSYSPICVENLVEIYLFALLPYISNISLEFLTYTCMIIIYAWNKQYSAQCTMRITSRPCLFLRSTPSSF